MAAKKIEVAKIVAKALAQRMTGLRAEIAAHLFSIDGLRSKVQEAAGTAGNLQKVVEAVHAIEAEQEALLGLQVMLEVVEKLVWEYTSEH